MVNTQDLEIYAKIKLQRDVIADINKELRKIGRKQMRTFDTYKTEALVKIYNEVLVKLNRAEKALKLLEVEALDLEYAELTVKE